MMRILCFVKLVPDVENFKYDYERNVLVRENVQLVINPEDASSLAFALSLKKEYPDTYIETVSMAPRGVVPHLEDLVRRGVDRATLLSDRLYAGSDTYATSCILGRFVSGRSFDWIFSGTHTLDGGTAHVPPQVAELLGLRQMSNIIDIDRLSLHTETAVVEVDDEEAVLRFGIDKPAVLSFQYSTKIKLPYITYEMIDADVNDNIHVLTNDDLRFEEREVGLAGSLTRVASVEVRKLDRKDTVFVRSDEEGIETVCRFLKERGFIES